MLRKMSSTDRTEEVTSKSVTFRLNVSDNNHDLASVLIMSCVTGRTVTNQLMESASEDCLAWHRIC